MLFNAHNLIQAISHLHTDSENKFVFQLSVGRVERSRRQLSPLTTVTLNIRGFNNQQMHVDDLGRFIVAFEARKVRFLNLLNIRDGGGVPPQPRWNELSNTDGWDGRHVYNKLVFKGNSDRFLVFSHQRPSFFAVERWELTEWRYDSKLATLGNSRRFTSLDAVGLANVKLSLDQLWQVDECRVLNTGSRRSALIVSKNSCTVYMIVLPSCGSDKQVAELGCDSTIFGSVCATWRSLFILHVNETVRRIDFA